MVTSIYIYIYIYILLLLLKEEDNLNSTKGSDCIDAIKYITFLPQWVGNISKSIHLGASICYAVS